MYIHKGNIYIYILSFYSYIVVTFNLFKNIPIKVGGSLKQQFSLFISRIESLQDLKKIFFLQYRENL